MPANIGFGYPFAHVVTPEAIGDALRACGVSYRKRLFDPATVVFAWMGQIASQDRSCRHAVSRVVAHHTGDRAVSARTGAYAQARQRLDVRVLQRLSRDLARSLEEECRAHWLIGRPAFAVDGTVISGPDTESLQSEYPQHGEMAPGIGFPLARVVLVVSLATGAIIDLAIVAHKGLGASEHEAYRQTWACLRPGDVVVGDRLYYSYWSFHDLRRLSVDAVCRKAEFPGTRSSAVMRVLGRDDRVYVVHKTMRPKWMRKPPFALYPPRQYVRVTGYRLDGGDGRERTIALISTLLNGGVRASALAELYHRRWNVELDIRSFKLDLGADILRCKTAEMVRKELWATALAYNAVRAIMARAAALGGVAPRSLSFKGALQAIDAFSLRMNRTEGAERENAMRQMLTAIASHGVGDRPGRVEPRLVKRRRKPIALMTVPRDEARRLCRGGRFD